MGNLQAESGLIPNRVEILCLKRLAEVGKHYTDATYTAFVDDGTISLDEFLHPLPGKQYGYGLAQWTSPGRKAGLYTLAKMKKVSIGDVGVQLEWLITELKQSYSSVWGILTDTQDIRTASDAVLTKFEQPADTGTAVQETRYKMSKALYDELKGSGGEQVAPGKVLSVMRSWIGYSEANGLHRRIVDIYNNYCAKRGYYPRGYRVPYDVAWCDVTVSAAFIEANAVSLIGDIECGVEEHVKIFQRQGIWIEDGSILPQVGDIVCYNWDDGTQPNDGYSDHIGIVEEVNGGSFTVIEGNMGAGIVGRRIINQGWGYIRGFARPKWSGGVTVEPAPEPEQKPAEQQKPATGGGLNKTERWVGRVTADELNVRTWAGAEYPNIKSWPVLKQGNLISVCDIVQAKNGDSWYYVKIADKYYGFVHSAYVEQA